MEHGNRVLKLRMAAGITQGALAERIDLRQDQLSRLENHTAPKPMTAEQYELARATLIAMVAERNLAWTKALQENGCAGSDAA